MQPKYSLQLKKPHNLESVKLFLASLKEAKLFLTFSSRLLKSGPLMFLGETPDKEFRELFDLPDKVEPSGQLSTELYWLKAYTMHCKHYVEQCNILRWDSENVEYDRKLEEQTKRYGFPEAHLLGVIKNDICESLSVCLKVLDSLIENIPDDVRLRKNTVVPASSELKEIRSLYANFSLVDDKTYLLRIYVNQTANSSTHVVIKRDTGQAGIMECWWNNQPVSEELVDFQFKWNKGSSDPLQGLKRKISEALEEAGWNKSGLILERIKSKKGFLKTNLFYKKTDSEDDLY